jgi:hypothetical protein
MKIYASVLSTLMAVSFMTMAKADESTTTTTTTVSTSTFALPSGDTFVVVDPISGALKGMLDPNTRLINGQALAPGMIVSDQVTGRVIAVVDANGNLMDITAAPVTSALLSAIDARRLELDRLLTDALANGKLTAAQATAMRSEMDRLVAAEVAAQQSGTVLTYAQVLPVAYGLTLLSNRLVPIVHTTIAPLIGQRIIVQDNVVLLADDLSFRRIGLERRIDDEYSAGRLSAKQVGELKQRLTEVASLQARYTRKGVISSSDQHKLERKMNDVQASMDRDIAYINGKRAKIGIRVN